MLGRMAGPGGGGDSEQRRQRAAALDFGRRHHTGTAAVPLSRPPPVVPPKLLFLAAATASGVVSGEKETMFSPPAELAGAVVETVSPTSTLQPPASSPITSTAATAVPFSWRGPTSSSSSSGGRQRPWEARPVRVGLAGALNGDGDAFQPAATTVLTTGQRMIRPCRQSQSSASSALVGSPESSSRSRCVLTPREVMMEASSEDYTRVIARGPNPRTTHIFDDRVVVVEDEFLRWCHGCSKDLGQGNDIFMYRLVSA